jgi:hypothetical protein
MESIEMKEQALNHDSIDDGTMDNDRDLLFNVAMFGIYTSKLV